ncbi:phage holin family protein [Amycolatopsis samaneae]|uniref:Phage holin family protein n=1 Tax=Amycolatopsis samaneae TaxID=664691 RepID=A0ABW5G7V4_9PSEU
MIEEANHVPAENRSAGELVSDLTDEVKRLVRDELRLARYELRDKGKHFGLGAGLFGAAGLLGVFGAATLVTAAVLALALVLPAWLSALLVGAALLVVAGIAALAGREQVGRAAPPVPEETLGSVREDIDTVKRGVRS